MTGVQTCALPISLPEFKGRYEMTRTGTLDGKPWTFVSPGGPQALQFKQYLRIEGMLDPPALAVVKTVLARCRIPDDHKVVDGTVLGLRGASLS